ncbi:type II toxin-antitoxin system RelE/ParE family toxin [Gemmatimonas sp.]|uniref:type II toxin-antitoxin system RelE/ParE family toxin n=1 Tax=Gemmatimonas sp. TaxID=1962908 RepID=UPI0035658C9C
MPRPVLPTPVADADIADAFAWNEVRVRGHGSDFLAELAATFSFLEEFPGAYLKMRGETRRAVVLRFPYGVFHLVDPDSTSVTGVLHFRRDPPAWPVNTDV